MLNLPIYSIFFFHFYYPIATKTLPHCERSAATKVPSSIKLPTEERSSVDETCEDEGSKEPSEHYSIDLDEESLADEVSDDGMSISNLT